MTRPSRLLTAASALALSSWLPRALGATESRGCFDNDKEPVLGPGEVVSSSVTVNGKQRDFYVRRPPGYDSTHPHKLIFTFHALGGTAEELIEGRGGYLPWYGLPERDVAESAGGNETAIYVAAQGLKNPDEFDGQLTGWANVDGEDLAFVDAILDIVEEDLCVDQDHRYSTGFSYGGAMSYALACDRAFLFRAVAVLSGGPMSGCAAGAQPVAYYGQHGVSDIVLPMALGRELRDRFVANNGCAEREAPEPAPGAGSREKTVYESCTHPTVFVAFDGDHTSQPKDAGANHTFAAEETWAFFSQFAQT